MRASPRAWIAHGPCPALRNIEIVLTHRLCAAVCLKVIDVFAQAVKTKKLKTPEAVEREIEKICRDKKGPLTDKKEERMCWYLGAMVRARKQHVRLSRGACRLQKDSATYLLREVSQPLLNSLPTERLCERLKTKDVAICELQYGARWSLRPLSDRLHRCFAEKKLDLSTVDIK